MSTVSIDMIVAGFVVLNVVLLAVSIRLTKAQSTPSLDELLRTVADNTKKPSE